MTDLATIPEGLPVVSPHTGELIHPQDLEALAALIDDLRQWKREEIDAAIKAAEYAILHERERLGLAGTIHVGGRTITITQSAEIAWDTEVLRELLDEGLPQERWDELVTYEVTQKINANTARTIAAANERYRAIVERAQTRSERPPRVSVK